MIEPEGNELALTAQTGLLGLNRSSLYYQPLPPSPEEIAVKHRIDELYTKYRFYGSRPITAVINREMVINRKAVQRHMREMGIAGICPGPNLSKRGKEHHLYPYLLRHVQAAYANHDWGIDITYIRLRAGWMYLVAVLDWFSRYVDSLPVGSLTRRCNWVSSWIAWVESVDVVEKWVDGKATVCFLSLSWETVARRTRWPREGWHR